MEYQHKSIEPKWQDKWQNENAYVAKTDSGKTKYYVLDMFPYPSGAGLHVGHPLGYIASDIIARYKMLKGFEVLHPMGFDAFGLPAEQYAIETGQHPAKTTEQNIATFKKQLGEIGFAYNWDNEVRTSQPEYYKWTQWIFLQLFHSWYNKTSNKAENISDLIAIFEKEGNANVKAVCDENIAIFSAQDWQNFSEKEKSDSLFAYRLTYLAETYVNWCPALGSVLANDEVKDGVSERGNHPVERKLMKQWMMRITAYADRMLKNLDNLDWSDALKEIQRNWIGKSYGCQLNFNLADVAFPQHLTVFTTRPDTIFGVSFVTLAPEHEWVSSLTTEAQQAEVEKYVDWAKNRSERERMENVKSVSGVFTGSYVLHPFTGARVPIWVSEYVLAGYGTGVVMGVPASDERDFRFAKHFNLPILPVIDKTEIENGEVKEAYCEKSGKMINSGFLTGLEVKDAIKKAIDAIEAQGLGKSKVNFKIRDAVFGRQRYWGEPIPMWYDENGIPQPLSDEELPLLLPEIDEYKPTAEGEPPLGRATDWKYEKNGKKYDYELTTMPGWAGSSWYFLRYMDNKNEKSLVDKTTADFWGQVDLYLGGSEHATGHLLYARFWNMFLFDLGLVSHEEPFQKLVNQGMIQGRSALVYQIKGENKFVSFGLKDDYETVEIHCDVNIVENDILDIEKFKNWRKDYENAEFILENGKFVCGAQVEKMSKRWYNVVNPSDVIARYGADTLRLFEMFLGPLEMSKPWNTSSIDGVSRFLRKLWRLFYDEKGNFIVSDEKADKAELKILHKTIKKIEEDIERLSLNTAVSAFMICINELSDKKCNKREVLSDFLILLAPYAPHISEELWEKLGNTESIFKASFPVFVEDFLKDDTIEYAIQINGKLRATHVFAADTPKEDIEQTVLALEAVQKWLEGNPPKKVIVVPKKLVNVVI